MTHPAVKTICPVGDGQHIWHPASWSEEKGDYDVQTRVVGVFCTKCLKEARL